MKRKKTTDPERLPCRFVGGPLDGEWNPVRIGESGEPVAYLQVTTTGALLAQTHTYVRDRDAGGAWIYVHRPDRSLAVPR